MKINDIIRKAIERLKNEGKLFTPDAYSDAFCKEAKNAGVLVEDCTHVDKFISTLDDTFKNELKNYNIKTANELFRFLISRLNRTQPSHCSNLLDAQSLLTKRILQVVSVLHNKDASVLAKKTLKLLDDQASSELLNAMRGNWNNFLTQYDDSFLQKLSAYANVDSEDLQKTIMSLELKDSSSSEHHVHTQDYTKVVSLLIASLIPSIASSVNDKIANISRTLENDPELVTSKEMEKEVKQAIALRIALDKESLNAMIHSLDDVVNKLSHQVIALIERSDNSNQEIKQVKIDLERLDIEAADFKTTHAKLYNIANTLEQKTQILSKDLTDHSSKIAVMAARIKELEDELEESQRASREDPLTKLYNKRAIDEFLAMKEDDYNRHNYEYAIVMFDIDYFKKVNDTYGHDAGDAVLIGVSSILKKLCRKSDIVGRYGGEEFIAIISDTEDNGALTFANKINYHVQNTNFMYKSTRIDVTISGGVAHRNENPSLKQTFKHADEKLYIAKKNGRNQIVQ